MTARLTKPWCVCVYCYSVRTNFSVTLHIHDWNFILILFMLWCKAIVLFCALTYFTIWCSPSTCSWFIIVVCPLRRAVYLLKMSVVLMQSDSHHLSKCTSCCCYFCWLCICIMLLLYFCLSFCWPVHFPTSCWRSLLFSVCLAR